MERNKENRDKLADQSPDEAKQTVKDKVAKGVATVAGALEGFAEQAKKDDLPRTTKEAVKKAGETTRQVAETTREQGRKVKQSVRGDRPSSSDGPAGSMGNPPQRPPSSPPATRSSNRPGEPIGSPTPSGMQQTAGLPDSPSMLGRRGSHSRSASATSLETERSEAERVKAKKAAEKRDAEKRESEFRQR